MLINEIKLQIPGYQGLDWTGHRLLELEIPELSVWTFEAYQGSKKISMVTFFFNSITIFNFYGYFVSQQFVKTGIFLLF